MRIIDKNTDFYDYLQGIYQDRSITFDRTDSYVLTKEIMCQYLQTAFNRYHRDYDRHSFILLQVCNTFWLFLVEITELNSYGRPSDYEVELVKSWKNYNKERQLLKLDSIRFGWHLDRSISYNGGNWVYDRDVIHRDANVFVGAIDTGEFEAFESFNQHTVFYGAHSKAEKHIPILKASGLAQLIDPLEIFLAIEEYFSLEKTARERTTSIGLTDIEKVENHGFDAKTSFRGKQ